MNENKDEKKNKDDNEKTEEWSLVQDKHKEKVKGEKITVITRRY